MTESEIDAAYGPVQASYRVSRRSWLVAIGVSVAAVVVGALMVGAALLFHRDGERSSTELGLGLTGGILGLLTPLVVARATWQSAGDVLELRAMGVVRRSKVLGLKHVRYAELARIEELRRGERMVRMDVLSESGTMMGLSGYERDPRALADDLEQRARNAGASVRRELTTH